jgi:hypothetical protein
VAVPAHDRARLERLCRYTLRPPVAHDRVHLTPEERIVLELRHRWSDGTTHLIFDPLELLERLAALMPRPRINLLFYYGVVGARAAWRGRLVPSGVASSTSSLDTAAPGASAPVTLDPRRNYLWAELMRRTFGLDVLVCPHCGDRLVLTALIEDPQVIRRILGHLDVPTEVPATRPARSPPLPRLPHDGDEAAVSRSARAPDRSPGRREYDPHTDVP